MSKEAKILRLGPITTLALMLVHPVGFALIMTYISGAKRSQYFRL